MRLLVHEERYTPSGDCEGLTHAEMINEHLPPQIRVFAVQKTNKARLGLGDGGVDAAAVGP